MKKTSCLFMVLLLAVSLQAEQDVKSIRKNAIKTTFLSFITGSAKLTYERVTIPGQSFEITGGIIGVGFDKFENNPKGVLFRFAYKFMFLQPQETLLTGFYIKPEYAVSAFHYDAKNINRVYSSWQTIMGCTGYQWNRKMLVLDGFAGAGFGWGNPTELRYHHGFIDRRTHLTLTLGMKIGLAF
ncbi:MAG: hypothetical protein FWE63_06260 [Bacteroidales bacterium]|nr:hypothetical protein [Bacteroidales bacterium]